MKIRTKILILAVSILFFACQNMNQKNKPLMTDKCGEYVLMENYNFDTINRYEVDCSCHLKLIRLYDDEHEIPDIRDLDCSDTIVYKDSIVYLHFIKKDSLLYLASRETTFESKE